MEKQELQSFKDLFVWQKAADLATMIYFVTENFPKSELYGIVNQLRRAVISISSNIAEGFKRTHKKEKLQFYNIAYGSAAELESQIEISLKLNFVNQNDYTKIIALVAEVSKMLDGLIKSQRKCLSYPKSYILYSISFFLFLFSIFYFLSISSASAAEIIVNTGVGAVSIGQQFEINVFLNAPDENINAVEGKLLFPSALLKLERINNGNSILNYWIDKPSLARAGEIKFSGMMPGGYDGGRGLIFSAVFTAVSSGRAELKLTEAKALLNDGLGTAAKLSISNAQTKIAKAVDGAKSAPISQIDAALPDEFSLQVSRDANIFDNEWFIAFVSQDKGLGIDYYLAQENRRHLIKENKWKTAESPYKLRDQRLTSWIFVKAVDKAGNFRLAELAPQNFLLWYEKFSTWCIILIGLMIIAFGILWRDRWKKSKRPS